MNRKVVWNDCYGGFSLSPIATKKFYERKYPGKTIYFYEEELDCSEVDKNYRTFYRLSEEEVESSRSIVIHCVFLDFGEKITLEKGSVEEMMFYENDTFNFDIEIKRHDPDLVAVVEELGTEKASGRCACLKIEDIGDSKYHIDEYDGYETVITKLDENYWQ